MQDPNSHREDLLVLVDVTRVRIRRLEGGGVRSIVQVPLTGTLTVAVAARVVDALRTIRPVAEVVVLPLATGDVDAATELASHLLAAGSVPVLRLPALPRLTGQVLDAPPPTPPGSPQRLPAPGPRPHTVRLSPTPSSPSL